MGYVRNNFIMVLDQEEETKLSKALLFPSILALVSIRQPTHNLLVIPPLRIVVVAWEERGNRSKRRRIRNVSQDQAKIEVSESEMANRTWARKAKIVFIPLFSRSSSRANPENQFHERRRTYFYFFCSLFWSNWFSILQIPFSNVFRNESKKRIDRTKTFDILSEPRRFVPRWGPCIDRMSGGDARQTSLPSNAEPTP